MSLISICTQYSASIFQAMQLYHADPVVVHYEPYAKEANDALVESITRHEQVIFNAGGGNYSEMIKRLHGSGVEVYGIYHSSFCGLSFDHLFTDIERHNLEELLRLSSDGHLARLGFVHKGSADFYRELGYDTHWTPNIPMAYHGPTTRLPGEINIGVFTAANAMKNYPAALACACAVPGARVHTVHPPPFEWPGVELTRTVEAHGWMNLNQLLVLMGSMDVNLMLSFTESYGFLVTQSWAMGVPCLIGPACRPIASPELWATMGVERLDNAMEICSLITSLAGMREEHTLQTQLEECVTALIEIGTRQREQFLTRPQPFTTTAIEAEGRQPP
jgi:hypothetical protein